MSEYNNHNESEPHNEHPERPRTEQDASREPLNTDCPKVWIGSLADYNAGILTGDWVDAAVDDQTLIEP